MFVATICVVSKRPGGINGNLNQHQLLLQAILDIGSLWSLVVFLLMLSRVLGFGLWRTGVAYVLGLAWALPLLIALVIRTFLFQPFDAASWSMAPTLLMGDHFFVSKYAYGYTRYSIPFSPRWFYARILASEPTRGDVAVFRTSGGVEYAKRVIGLPGDRIQMRASLHQRRSGDARAISGFCRRGRMRIRCLHRREAVAGHYAEWRELRDIGLHRQWLLGQHRRLYRAGRACLPDGG